MADFQDTFSFLVLAENVSFFALVYNFSSQTHSVARLITN